MSPFSRVAVRITTGLVLFLLVTAQSPNTETFQGKQGWQTLSENKPTGNYVMVPKYEQNNHMQMVLGAKFAEHEADGRKVVDWYPDRDQADQDQIDMIADAVTGNAKAFMIANNAGSDIEDGSLAARDAGLTIVSYDSPIAGGADAGENLFVTGVDFGTTGEVMADMALNILGTDGGDFCVMSPNPKATNQNIWIKSLKNTILQKKYKKLNLVGVFFPVKDNLEGYKLRTREIVNMTKGEYPNLRLIMAPSTSASAAAAKTLLEDGNCDIMKVSGLSVPAEMLEAAEQGCAPEFALFNNLDLGYLAYFATRAISNGDVEGKAGDEIPAGRLGTRTIEEDSSRNTTKQSLKLTLGPFIKYNPSNVERAAFIDCIQGFCGDSGEYFEKRFMKKYKKRALAIIPKVTGAISFLCSLYLVYHILHSKKRRNDPFERIILGLSVGDMITSLFGFVLSTWAMPKDTFLAWGAAGTTATCSMQGFMFQLGILATPLYNVVIGFYYLLKVVFGWKESRLRKFEWLFHGLPWSFALATAITGLILKLYNPSPRGSMCWIEEYPPYCSSSLSCTRGAKSSYYRWGFLYGIVLLTVFWLTFCMGWLWYFVISVERKLDKYRVKGEAVQRKNSRQISQQAFFYVVAFAIPWISGIIVFLTDNKDKVFESEGYDGMLTLLHLANACIFPLQGLLNVLVYVRPRYLRLRARKLDARQIGAKLFRNTESIFVTSKSKIPVSGASSTGVSMVEINSDKFKSESTTDLKIHMASKAFEKASKTNVDVEAELLFRIDNG